MADKTVISDALSTALHAGLVRSGGLCSDVVALHQQQLLGMACSSIACSRMMCCVMLQ